MSMNDLLEVGESPYYHRTKVRCEIQGVIGATIVEEYNICSNLGLRSLG